LPQATYASSIELNGESLLVTRETDDGRETVEMTLPAVITVDLSPQRAALRHAPQSDEGQEKAADVDGCGKYRLDISPRYRTLIVR